MADTLSGEKRFDLKRQLADTLQGRIYSAIDKKTGEWVVVKETWKQLVKIGKSRDGHSVPENFEEEKRILKFLSGQKDADQGFVRLIDEWEDKDCFLYAMEMCRGGELFEYVKGIHTDGALAHFTKRQTKLKQEAMKAENEWVQVVQGMFRQVAVCTAWMHSKGVCHLDMSLENSMIASQAKKSMSGRGNQVKIIDFGLARYYPNGKFSNNRRVGKTGYMAPEVYSRKKYDPRAADIWSLGVMLFMMLIGAPPYQLPSASNPAFSFIVNGRLKDVLKHWKRLRLVSEGALDLMNQIFKYEAKRISMEQLLKHPFVAQAAVPAAQAAQADKAEAAQLAQNEDEKGSEQAEPLPAKKEEAQLSAVVQEKVDPESNSNSKQAAMPSASSDVLDESQFRSAEAKKFIEQLSKVEEATGVESLTNIMRDLEQTHNSMQRKLNDGKKSKAKQSADSTGQAKIQQTIKELCAIHSTVEQRLDQCNVEASAQKKNQKALDRRHPHSSKNN